MLLAAALHPAGVITALEQAMTVAAAALRRLVQQRPLDMQQLPQLLHLFSYVLALLNAWNSCNKCVVALCTSPPWPSTFPALAALGAALLEAIPVLSATKRWEDFEFFRVLAKSVTSLAVIGQRLDVHLRLAVGFARHNPHLMGLLGSQDVLSLVMYEAAGIARDLHNTADGKLLLPAAAPTGSSSSGRRSQAQQPQQQAVPASHDRLFEAIGGRPLLSCINLEGADKRWNPPPPVLQMRALVCVNALRLLLLGQAVDPGPDPGSFDTFEDMLAAAAAARAPLDTWPPAATFAPGRQQQLVGPLMQVVVELLLLLPDGADGKQHALLQGLELLHHLAGLQQPHAPGLVAMVEPVLLLLGLAVTHAVAQQQGAASSAWAVEAWQRYGLLLARLLCSGEWPWLQASSARDSFGNSTAHKVTQ
jgi:hypothetical protein